MLQNTPNFSRSLSQFQEKFELLLNENIPLLGDKSPLLSACEYALKNGGKRFRPFLVQLVAEALHPNARVHQASLAVEYFHTASLIADDLPCMDNDDERRSKPSLHKAYGESIALLASYALIAAGYGCLAKNARDLGSYQLPYASQSDVICTLALDNVTQNTGLRGATGGQFLDIYPPDTSLDSVKEVIYKKTVSLFEISFVLGWLYAGGDTARLPEVKEASGHFGMAFQIIDDLGDQEQDIINGRKINVPTIIGHDKAIEMFFEEISAYRKKLKILDIATPELLGLADYLEAKVQETLSSREMK